MPNEQVQTPPADQNGGVQNEQKPAAEPTLDFLNKTLGRNFTSVEEATKMLTNLNSMVGDQAIAALRVKASEAENFDKLVGVYAQRQGVDVNEARKDLLAEISQAAPQVKPVDNKAVTPVADSGLAGQVQELKQRLEERDLLEKYPESKMLLSQIKQLATNSHQTLLEAFEGSALKDVLSKADKFDKANEKKPSTSPNPTPGLAIDSSDTELISNVKKFGREIDRTALVKKALGY